MSTPTHYDAVVIGAGQAGGPLSTALAGAGLKTALIEREHYGGTCVNVGCTPTKTMITSGRVAYLARRGPDYGIETGPVTIDERVVRARTRQVVDDFRRGSESSVHGVKNLDAIDGDATFTGPKAIRVGLRDGGTAELTADRFFINAGERPAIPDIPGINDVPYLTSTSILELDEVPEHLVVIGGSYIALEFGQLFRRLGGRVTMLVRGAKLMGREDDDIADAVRDIMTDDGIDIRFQTPASNVSSTGTGIDISLADRDGGSTHLTASHLLLATGRTPNTDTLGLENAGVRIDDHGYIVVNERLETTAGGIYALGDIKGGPAFTHISYDDFRIIRDDLLGGGHRTTRDRIVAYTMFTDPQLGRVGMTERQARETGRNILVATLPGTSVARALETDETRGLMKAVVDADSKEILGAAILCVEGGDVATVLQVAMMGGLPYTAIRDGAFSHPTWAESLNNLFMTLDDAS